jgi:PPOX class probable F420-dependent enzyme
MAATSIADAKYVSLVTFRKNGTPVASPVWIAPLGDGTAGFTTDGDSGKVKRLRNNTSVTLQPCDARGRVKPGTATVETIATVVRGADVSRVQTAIRRKYQVLGPLLMIGGKLAGMFRKGQTPGVAVVITLPHG